MFLSGSAVSFSRRADSMMSMANTSLQEETAAGSKKKRGHSPRRRWPGDVDQALVRGSIALRWSHRVRLYEV